MLNSFLSGFLFSINSTGSIAVLSSLIVTKALISLSVVFRSFLLPNLANPHLQVEAPHEVDLHYLQNDKISVDGLKNVVQGAIRGRSSGRLVTLILTVFGALRTTYTNRRST